MHLAQQCTSRWRCVGVALALRCVACVAPLACSRASIYVATQLPTNLPEETKLPPPPSCLAHAFQRMPFVRLTICFALCGTLSRCLSACLPFCRLSLHTPCYVMHTHARLSHRPDPSTYADCLAIIHRLEGAADAIPGPVMARLALGNAGKIPDTAGADHPAFCANASSSGGGGGGDDAPINNNNVLVGTNAIAVKAAAAAAKRLGYAVVPLGNNLGGNARALARSLVKRAAAVRMALLHLLGCPHPRVPFSHFVQLTRDNRHVHGCTQPFPLLSLFR